ETIDVVNGREITIIWSGDSILAMSDMNSPMPLFSDPNSSVGSGSGGPTNQAPQVSAGADQSIWQNRLATLRGTVSDDQLPSDPGTVAVDWSLISGPGTVAFADSSSLDTTAQFSTPGEYVLGLRADDGERTATDEITIRVVDASAPITIAFQDGVFPTLNYSGTRDTYLHGSSSKVNNNYGKKTTLLVDGSPDVAALMAWDVSAIPGESDVVSAAIQLNITDKTSHGYAVYALDRAWDELAANWNQAASGDTWSAAGANGQGDYDATVLGQLSPRSKGLYTLPLNDAGLAVVRTWINDSDANNGLILKDFAFASDNVLFSTREAASPTKRPKLVVTIRPPDDSAQSSVMNSLQSDTAAIQLPQLGAGSYLAIQPMAQYIPPRVYAGPDQILQLPNAATLNGMITVDPTIPATVTTRWTVVSGPGTVTFSNSSSPSATSVFSTAGTYVLRLTASDGETEVADEVSIVVQAVAPSPNYSTQSRVLSSRVGTKYIRR
ncbi:MAG: DNRLRE domain-containing protein, partial [Planctomycetes bacterium]|nr:DNRLRE domain-containing protein [Planctomycetota bacterium]